MFPVVTDSEALRALFHCRVLLRVRLRVRFQCPVWPLVTRHSSRTVLWKLCPVVSIRAPARVSALDLGKHEKVAAVGCRCRVVIASEGCGSQFVSFMLLTSLLRHSSRQCQYSPALSKTGYQGIRADYRFPEI